MPAAPQPTPPLPAFGAAQDNPMMVHVRVVAIIELVWGGLLAVGGLVVLAMVIMASALSNGAGAPGFVPGIIASFGLLFVVILGVLAAVGLLGGMRLLKLRRSGRTFSYACAALSLLSFPLGTAFGIYAFIILTKPQTDQLLVNP